MGDVRKCVVLPTESTWPLNCLHNHGKGVSITLQTEWRKNVCNNEGDDTNKAKKIGTLFIGEIVAYFVLVQKLLLRR